MPGTCWVPAPEVAEGDGSQAASKGLGPREGRRNAPREMTADHVDRRPVSIARRRAAGHT